MSDYLKDKLQIRAEESIHRSGVNIYMFDDKSMCTEIVMKPRAENLFFPEALFINYQQAQILMDDLWKAGVRPTDKIDDKGELKATKIHLEDMRKVFEKFVFGKGE